MRANAMSVLRGALHGPAFETDDLLAAWKSRDMGAPRSQLATLAVSVQLDSFTKVKEMMDKMVVNLKKEQEEEVKFKAYCTKEFNDNEKATYAKTEEKEDLD